jgi:hypothetical protein
MSVDSDEQDIKERLAKTTAGEVRLGDDVVVDGDYYDLVLRSCMIAQVFGMGQCRTISEFIQMIDDEDPLVIQTCMMAIVNINRRMWGDNDDKPGRPPSDRQNNVAGKPSTKPARRVPAGSDSDLSEFILAHGKNRAEVIEWKKKVQEGKIKIPDTDFSHLTKENVMSDDFNLKAELKRMDEHRKRTKNFTLHIGDFFAFQSPKKK